MWPHYYIISKTLADTISYVSIGQTTRVYTRGSLPLEFIAPELQYKICMCLFELF